MGENNAWFKESQEILEEREKHNMEAVLPEGVSPGLQQAALKRAAEEGTTVPLVIYIGAERIVVGKARVTHDNQVVAQLDGDDGKDLAELIRQRVITKLSIKTHGDPPATPVFGGFDRVKAGIPPLGVSEARRRAELSPQAEHYRQRFLEELHDNTYQKYEFVDPDGYPGVPKDYSMPPPPEFPKFQDDILGGEPPFNLKDIRDQNAEIRKGLEAGEVHDSALD